VIGSLAASAAFGLYRVAGRLGAPLLRAHLARRRARGREDPARFAERFGESALPRPAGPLVWLHAASVGESISALPLVARLHSGWPEISLLVTTGTVTSARLMAERLPTGVIHQYVPVDLDDAVTRFFAHWRPALGLIFESELWPNLLRQARRTGCTLVLVNGRMSAASAASWRRAAPLIRCLLGHFAEIFAQSPEDLAHFQALGAPRARCLGNLKLAAPPLAADEAELASLQAACAGRPVWLAASTHPGEEAIAGQVHKALAARFPGLLTLIEPRHPDRGPEIAAELAAQGLAVARRGAGEAPNAKTDIYLADTLGELGLWYRLAEVVFVGNSLGHIGGHNPLEPARLDCALLSGPGTGNFIRLCDEMESAGALRRVAAAADLSRAVGDLLADRAERARMAAAAQSYAEAQAGVLDALLEALTPHLDRAAAEKA
jgi:3-deoxy-D-manno-octulosonic-acid transferase